MILQKGRQVTPFRMSSGVEFRFVVDKIGVLASSSVLPLLTRLNFLVLRLIITYQIMFSCLGVHFVIHAPTGATGWMYLEVVDMLWVLSSLPWLPHYNTIIIILFLMAQILIIIRIDCSLVWATPDEILGTFLSWSIAQIHNVVCFGLTIN